MTQLTAFNYLNLIGYILNVFFTFSASRIFGFPGNIVLSDKYQSIVTPTGLTFSIWFIIFVSQAIFVIIQMMPKYRGAKRVQEGVSYWYFVACIFQTSWQFAFGYEILPLSVVVMGGILVSLIMIVYKQSKIESEQGKKGIQDFWLYKFPFSVHCGWIFAEFADNINAMIVSFNAGVGTQTAFGYVTFVYIALVAAFALSFLRPPDFTIPSVLVWFTIGIVLELGEPPQQILDQFDEDFISLFRNLTIAICATLGAVTAGYGVYRVVTGRNTTNQANNETEPIVEEA